MKLQLFRPLKNHLMISQNFGENNCCIKSDGTGKVIPRTGATCPIGYISVYKFYGMAGHNGLDFPAKDWEPVFSSTEGIVIELSTEPERGLGVGIETEQKYEWSDAFSAKQGENQFKIRYWHLAALNVKPFQKVKVGDVIGWADNTGMSTGTHLHYEIKPTDKGVNVMANSSMFGAIDPLPYLQDLTAYEKSDMLYKIKLMLMDIAVQIEDLLLKK